MIQPTPNPTHKIIQNPSPSQSPNDKLLQNLNKSTLSSHGHTKSPLSEPKSQLSIANPQKNPIPQNPSTSRIESAKRQLRELQAQDNEFMNQEEINHKILLNGYFSSLGKEILRKNTQSIAKKYSSKIEDHLSSNIIHGLVKISKHQESIQNLLQEFKLSAQELKILQKRTQTQTKLHKIMLLDPFSELRSQRHTSREEGQKGSLQKAILNNFVTSAVLSKEQHKKLVQKFNLSNKQNQQRKKERLFQIEERQRSLSHEKSLAQAEKIKKQKQFKKLSIQQKLIKRKKNHQSFILQQKISTQKYMEMKNKKFLYEHMEEKYKSQVLIPSLEEKKIKLKEIRDLHKKYDIEQIKRHEQEYLEKKSESSSKQNSRHKVNSFQYNPPERSKRLEQLLEQERYKAKIKFEEKKRIAEQNKIKQINFLSDIKIKYKPKIDETKRQEIQKRLKSDEAKQEKSVQRDLKLLGMKHFEESKKFIKRTKKQKTQTEEFKKPEHKSQRESTNLKQKTEGNNFNDKSDEENEFLKVKISRKSSAARPQKRINMSFSQNSNHKINLQEEKRKQLRKIINSKDLEWGVKFERLKSENERLSEIYKRRENFFRDHEDDQKTREQAVGLLLNSIQAKMGLIDLCTKN